MSVAVSVIMPVYNAESFLQETLNSLSQQTLRDFEIICVNDGSTDKTINILKKIRKKLTQPMYIISQKNAGPGVARNKGFQLASGEYTIFLDADDVYEPAMLEQAYKRALSTNADVVVMRSDEFYPAEDNRHASTPWTINAHLLPNHAPFAGADIQQNIFEAFVGWPWDKLIRTKFIRDNHLQFQEIRSSEDASFCFMSIILAKRIATINDILIHHRKVAGSVSQSREKSWWCFYEALLDIHKQLVECHLYKRYERDFINYSLNFSLWHLTTLTGEAYFQLYDKLRHEWWAELGVSGRKSDYFYSIYHYNLYQTILNSSAQEFLFIFRDQKIKELDQARQELELAQNQISQLSSELNARNQQINNLYQSATWKTGRLVTFPARALRRSFKKNTKKNLSESNF